MADRQHHQKNNKDDCENQNAINDRLLRQQMHEKPCYQESFDRGDDQRHEDGLMHRQFESITGADGQRREHSQADENRQVDLHLLANLFGAVMMRIGITNAGVFVNVDAGLHRGCRISQVVLLLHEVQNREKKNPDKVNEMPVEADDLDPVRITLRLFGPHLRARPEEIEKDDHTAENEQAVQPCHREVDAQEVVGLREAAFLKFVSVFESFVDEKKQCAEDRYRNINAAELEISKP